jgi:FlaA1/EpsC-like NDP-sugar epimerase
VAPLFKGQIAAGGPVRITHRDMERYFMLLDEAVDLLLRAASRAPETAGESPILLMEMGRPIKIEDMARRMIAVLAPGQDIEIVFTGLREGEKLTEQLSDEHETLLSSGDDGLWRIQPVAAGGRVNARVIADLETAARGASDTVVRQRLFGALDDALGRLTEAAG